jgi:Spy/CpxP family protein refolding chaperone
MRYPERPRTVLSFFVVGLFTVASVTTFATAQERQGRRVGREDLEGLMLGYVISKMQEALELTDEQFGQMVVAQKKITEHRRKYRTGRQQTLKQLRQALKDPETEDPQITAMLTQLEDSKSQFEAQQRADYQAIDEILNVRQRARYRLLEVDIQRRFQQMVREVQERRNPKPRPQ